MPPPLDLLTECGRTRSGLSSSYVERIVGLDPSSRISGLLLAFQNPHDREDCVPVARCCRHTEKPVDLAEVGDGLHVPTVHSEYELLLRRDNSNQPLSIGRECDGQSSAEARGFRHDAHESNDIWTWWLGSKRVLCLKADNIASVAEHNFRPERQPPEQFSTELCPRPRFANDKRSGSAHIDDIVIAQFSGKKAWAKRPVSANVDASKQDD
jgi:hypothetical protein